MEMFNFEHFEQNLYLVKLLATVITVLASVYLIKKWKQGTWCNSTNLLTGKTVIVTGASSGIGKEAARDFYNRGARVIIADCNLNKAVETVDDIKSTSCNQNPTGEVLIHYLDLANFSSIKTFANHILTTETRIDILVNNAGIIRGKKMTVDGFDMTFQTNYLGHFLLTNLLLDKMKISVPSRIVNVASDAHIFSEMHWSDLNLNETGAYNSLKAYCQSKLANVLFTKELACRLQDARVNVYAVHPGHVQTDLDRYKSDWFDGVYSTMFCCAIVTVLKPYLKTPKQGAQTTIHCAVTDEVSNETGLYYSDCCERKLNKRAMDKESAKKLWNKSAEMVKLVDALGNFDL